MLNLKLPKYCKLRKTAEFIAVLNFKQKISGDFIQVYVKSNDTDHERLGLIVSKKIMRHAVKRNWVKRILRENFRLSRNQVCLKKMDWVVRLKRSVNKEDAAKLMTEMHVLMAKLQQCPD